MSQHTARAIFAFALALLAVPSTAQTAADIHVGAGSQSCGQWLEGRRRTSTRNTVTTAAIASWVQGYIIGSAKAESDNQMVDEIAERIARGELPPTILDADPHHRLLALGQAKFKTYSGWVFDPPDYAAIDAWLDKYCREHPLEVVLSAAGAFTDELTPASK